MDPFGFVNPTDFSKFRINEYMKTIYDGSARQDLLKVRKYGVSTKNNIERFCWKIFEDRFRTRKDDFFMMPSFVNWLKLEVELEYKHAESVFDFKSSPWHAVNGFRFLGLLFLSDEKGMHKYYFDPVVIVRGIEWFRVGNLYLSGLFQKESGLFPELIIIK